MGMSLEARLQRLEDMEEIRRVIMDYGRFLDARDFKAYANLFAENGTWEGGFGTFTGPKLIEEMIGKAIGGSGPMSRPNYHLMSSPEIDVDGDKATAWSRWTFVMNNEEDRPVIAAAGEYHDNFVREKGRWKFQRRFAGAPRGPAPSR